MHFISLHYGMFSLAYLHSNLPKVQETMDTNMKNMSFWALRKWSNAWIQSELGSIYIWTFSSSVEARWSNLKYGRGRWTTCTQHGRGHLLHVEWRPALGKWRHYGGQCSNGGLPQVTWMNKNLPRKLRNNNKLRFFKLRNNNENRTS